MTQRALFAAALVAASLLTAASAMACDYDQAMARAQQSVVASDSQSPANGATQPSSSNSN